MYIKEGLKDGISDPGAAHYEEEFEFPFWKLVRKRAEEKDMSFSDAAAEVCPEYSRTLKVRDVEWTDAQIAKSENEGFAEVLTYAGRKGETQKYKVETL